MIFYSIILYILFILYIIYSIYYIYFIIYVPYVNKLKYIYIDRSYFIFIYSTYIYIYIHILCATVCLKSPKYSTMMLVPQIHICLHVYLHRSTPV